MNKKIIALLICVFYIITSFATFAADNEISLINDDDYSRELSVVSALNPNYVLPVETNVFSRSQFVKLLIDVMCPQYGTEADTGFEDVSSTELYAASLKFAKDFGIISPATTFSPDDAVTYTQATKMLVTALGYKPLADAKGGYPTGYLSLASDMDLFDDVDNKGDKPLTIRDGLKLICNMLDKIVLVQTGFGSNFVYDSTGGKTFLEYYHKIKTTYGIVNANEYTSLTDSTSALGEGYIKIGISDYKSAGDFASLLGYNVKAYITDNDTVVYAEKYECGEIVLNTDDIDSVNGFNIIVAEGIKEKKYTLDDSFAYIRNGKATAITSADFTPYIKFDTGSVALVDNDNDKKFDVVVATSYNYLVVSKVSAGEEIVLYDANSSANSITLGLDTKYSIKSLIDDGTRFSVKDITSGMLVAYTVSDDKKLYNVYVMQDIVDGKITGVDSVNDYIYINDVAYNPASYFKTYYSNTGLGAEASFAIGIDGKLVAVCATGESYLKYGWFVGFSTPTGLAEQMLKIFSQTGEMEILKLADKVLVDGVSTSASSVKSLIQGFDDVKRLIKYSSNDKGELKRIDTYVDALQNELETGNKDSNNSLTKFCTGSYRFKSGSGLFVPSELNNFSFHVEGSTVSFIIPSSPADRTDDSKFGVVSSTYFETDQTYSGTTAFDVNKYGCAAATLMFGSKREGGSLTNYTSSAVIEKITSGLNNEGENTLLVYAYRGGKYGVYYADKELTYDYISILNPGDIVRFVTDSDNVITNITRDFNAKTFEISSGYSSVAGILEYISGISYSANEKYMNIITNPQITATNAKMPQTYSIDNIRNINISSTSVVYVDLVKRADGTIVSALPRMSEITDIKSYLDSGDNANFVVARQYILSPQLTVVYNIEVK